MATSGFVISPERSQRMTQLLLALVIKAAKSTCGCEVCRVAKKLADEFEKSVEGE